MKNKSKAARAVAYLRTNGCRRFVRRLREVCSGYLTGAALSFGGEHYAFPDTSRPSAPELLEIIFLGCIEWTYRFQRPQHLCLELAEAGCRVHYISPTTLRSRSRGWHISNPEKAGRLWRMSFLAPQRITFHELYTQPASAAAIEQSLQTFVNRLSDAGRRTVIIAQHPYWERILQNITGTNIIYDCLDDYSGFSHQHREMPNREQSLVSLCSGIVTTSQHLSDKWRDLPQPQALIRNACEYEHFATRPERVFSTPCGRPVLGYFGAIEDWFDVELVEQLSKTFSNCTLLLVGGATPPVLQRLRQLPNAVLPGEVPYTDLPRYVHAFSVALMPFRMQPLTLGVNPVKVYEYLAAGLPVVTVPLPEMQQFGDLARTGLGDDFVKAVGEVLASGYSAEEVAARQAFAKQETWERRAEDLIGFLRSFM